MRQTTRTLKIRTHGKGLVDITEVVEDHGRDSDIANGLVTLFCRHTSASRATFFCCLCHAPWMRSRRSASMILPKVMPDIWRKLVGGFC